MRSALKMVSTLLFATSLTLGMIAISASYANASGIAADCGKVYLAGDWYCSGNDNCPQGTYCSLTKATNTCDCQ